MKSRFILFLLSLPFFLCAPLFSQEPPDAKTIIEAVERNEARILDISCTSEKTLVDMFDLESPDIIKRRLKSPLSPKTEKYADRFHLWYSEEKLSNVQDDNSVIFQTNIKCFDGKKQYYFTPEVKQGGINERSHWDPSECDFIRFLGFDIDWGTSNSLSARLKNAQNLKVTSAPGFINGEKTFILEFQEEHQMGGFPGAEYRIVFRVFVWVAKEKNFAPVRIGYIRYSKGKPSSISRTDVAAFMESQTGLFLPREAENFYWYLLSDNAQISKGSPALDILFNPTISRQEFIEGYKVKFFYHYHHKMTTVDVNRGLSKNDFVVDFPHGTVMYNGRLNCSYLLHPDPKDESSIVSPSLPAAQLPLLKEKLNLSILYAGYIESTRAKDFLTFLSRFFREVKAMSVLEFKEQDATGYDVVIIDNKLYSNESRNELKPRLSQSYSRPTITLGVTGAFLGDALKLKTGYL
jgi:hypothetical protein